MLKVCVLSLARLCTQSVNSFSSFFFESLFFIWGAYLYFGNPEKDICKNHCPASCEADSIHAFLNRLLIVLVICFVSTVFVCCSYVFEAIPFLALFSSQNSIPLRVVPSDLNDSGSDRDEESEEFFDHGFKDEEEKNQKDDGKGKKKKKTTLNDDEVGFIMAQTPPKPRNDYPTICIFSSCVFCVKVVIHLLYIVFLIILTYKAFNPNCDPVPFVKDTKIYIIFSWVGLAAQICCALTSISLTAVFVIRDLSSIILKR